MVIYLAKKFLVFMESIKIAALQKPTIGNYNKPFHSNVYLRTTFCQVPFLGAFAKQLRLLALPYLPILRSRRLTEQPEGELVLAFVLKLVQAFHFWLV